ncbi:hypothetical protein ABW21_db0203083 [Orbilia brochopaga]|nr:hypothetical protein ABW21_db0203083 [Drechslerella brochopaga]
MDSPATPRPIPPPLKLVPRTEPSMPSLRITSQITTASPGKTISTVPTSQTPGTPPRRISNPEVRPPEHTVNLDLPPRERYKEIAKLYSEQLQSISGIYDALFDRFKHKKLVQGIARHFLFRRVYRQEEQQEIKGIAEVSGMPLYLVVAYNTLLDTFMGCTSGAVKITLDSNKPESDEDRAEMLHFRTLDWGMDELRKLVILVNYQRGGKTIAQALTYAGFIGVLTGVRKGLSLSLNFRAATAANTTKRAVHLHKLLVLLGIRPSVSSQLRNFLFTEKKKELPTIKEAVAMFPRTPCTPCYVTFCDGEFASLLEKDITHANIDTTGKFGVVTNHDDRMEAWTKEEYDAYRASHPIPNQVRGAVDNLEDSFHRRRTIKRLYDAVKPTEDCSELKPADGNKQGTGITMKTVVSWMHAWPITNENTHFHCVMDAKVGKFSWIKYYEQPPA